MGDITASWALHCDGPVDAGGEGTVAGVPHAPLSQELCLELARDLNLERPIGGGATGGGGCPGRSGPRRGEEEELRGMKGFRASAEQVILTKKYHIYSGEAGVELIMLK